jgi:hypothetical protein
MTGSELDFNVFVICGMRQISSAGLHEANRRAGSEWLRCVAAVLTGWSIDPNFERLRNVVFERYGILCCIVEIA